MLGIFFAFIFVVDMSTVQACPSYQHTTNKSDFAALTTARANPITCMHDVRSQQLQEMMLHA